MIRKAFAAAVLALHAAGAACAPDEPAWPSKPLHILVPAGTGGVADVRARWLGGELQKALGQPVIVENKAGAAGIIGTEAGARSAPDGYTLVIVHQGTLVVNPHLYPHLGYDALRDFQPVTRLGYGPLMLAVNPALPVRDVQQLIALAKARRLSYGSPGIGTPPHLAAELFQREAGIAATHVPYKGGGQEVSDLIGGHIDFAIEGLTLLMPHVKAGRLRALAITSRERSDACPEVPTLSEAGLPDYEYQGWVGVALPAATPPALVAKVHAAIASVLASPEGRAWFAAAAANSTPDSPQAFAAFMREEYDKIGKVIREAGIQAQ